MTQVERRGQKPEPSEEPQEKKVKPPRILFLILLAVCTLSTACTLNEIPPSEPTAAPFTKTPDPAPVLLRTPSFEVVAWLDDPNPPVGSRVMLYGSLIKDGVHLLNGMVMRAIWPDEDQARGVPNCSVQVIYGEGVCIVETEGFQPDVFVPITVAIDYNGQTYRGQIGFIPR